MMRMLMFMVGIVLLVSTFSAGTHAAEAIVLAERGQAKAVIVVPPDPAPSVTFAAEELKHYLDRVTGAPFIVTDRKPASGPAIVLGDTSYTRQAGIRPDTFDRDEFIIATKKGTVYIAGRDSKEKKADILRILRDKPEAHEPVGSAYAQSMGYRWDFEKATLYGAYAFLEKLGVRWFFPGPLGEVVPKRGDLRFALDKDYQKKPHYLLRHTGTYWHGKSEHGPYGRRPAYSQAEYDALKWTNKRHLLWELRMGGLGKWMAVNHRPPRLKWRQRFGKSHPEYFALLKDGKRNLQGDWSKPKYWYWLCYTHPGVLRETVADIDAFFSGKPPSSRNIPTHPRDADNGGWSPAACYGDNVSLLPHDAHKACHCENCSKLLRPDLGRQGMSSDLVWNHVKEVAEAVGRKWPGKTVNCLAYADHTMPPTAFERLPDNITVGLCPKGLQRGYVLADEAKLGELLQFIEQWRTKTNHPFAIWLHHLYRHIHKSNPHVPMHWPRHAARLMQIYAKDARYMYVEMDRNGIVFDHLTWYAMKKAMWNPDLDVEAVLDDYVNRYYGPKAASVMKTLLDDIETKCTAIAAADSNFIGIYDLYFNRPTLDNYDKLLAKALELTKGTEYEPRVRHFEEFFLGRMKFGLDAASKQITANTTRGTAPTYSLDAPPAKAVPNERNILKNGTLEAWGDIRTPKHWGAQSWGGSRVSRDDTIVHSGNHSARLGMGSDNKPAVLSHWLGRDSLTDGKYKLSFFWYAKAGSMSMSLYFGLGTDEKGTTTFRHFDPTKGSWYDSEKQYRYHTINGKLNTWNKAEYVFDINAPEKKSGNLIFNTGGGKGERSIFIDDVVLERFEEAAEYKGTKK